MITHLVDIDLFDGGKQSVATFDTYAARDAYIIDFQKIVHEITAKKEKTLRDTTLVSKTEEFSVNDFLPVDATTIEQQEEIHLPTSPEKQKKENTEEIPNDK